MWDRRATFDDLRIGNGGVRITFEGRCIRIRASAVGILTLRIRILKSARENSRFAHHFLRGARDFRLDCASLSAPAQLVLAACASLPMSEWSVLMSAQRDILRVEHVLVIWRRVAARERDVVAIGDGDLEVTLIDSRRS